MISNDGNRPLLDSDPPNWHLRWIETYAVILANDYEHLVRFADSMETYARLHGNSVTCPAGPRDRAEWTVCVLHPMNFYNEVHQIRTIMISKVKNIFRRYAYAI